MRENRRACLAWISGLKSGLILASQKCSHAKVVIDQQNSAMIPHLFPVRVYYEDTDFSGAVYHANYLRFMERARTELLRSRGVHQGVAISGRKGEAFGFVVRRMEIDFLKPARMDDELIVETVAKNVGGATIDLTQRVLRGEELLASAKVRIGCVVDGRAGRLPVWVREKLGLNPAS